MSIYLGRNGLASRVSNMYVGVGGRAKTVTEGYVGVGGVARPFWTNQRGVQYYGPGPTLRHARTDGAAATAGEQILYGGGRVNDETVAWVEQLSQTLTLTDGTSLSVSRSGRAAAEAGGKALFAGGETTSGANQSAVDV